jgi:hypothetical protein
VKKLSGAANDCDGAAGFFHPTAIKWPADGLAGKNIAISLRGCDAAIA